MGIPGIGGLPDELERLRGERGRGEAEFRLGAAPQRMCGADCQVGVCGESWRVLLPPPDSRSVMRNLATLVLILTGLATAVDRVAAQTVNTIVGDVWDGGRQI